MTRKLRITGFQKKAMCVTIKPVHGMPNQKADTAQQQMEKHVVSAEDDGEKAEAKAKAEEKLKNLICLRCHEYTDPCGSRLNKLIYQ